LREWSLPLFAYAAAAAVAAAPLGIGGRIGVETDREAVNFSKDVRCRIELPDGLLGEPGVSSFPPFAITASIGRRGLLYRMVRLREGFSESESVTSAFRPVLVGDLVGDCSSGRCFDLLADGDGDREEELHGFRARLTMRPDMERLFEGRAAGSGALVSGTLHTLGFCDSVSSRFSNDDSVKCETATGGSFFERIDVRRRMSFPAATLSFVGEWGRVGTAQSEKVRLRPSWSALV